MDNTQNPAVVPLRLSGIAQETGRYARTYDGDQAFTFTSDRGDTYIVWAYASGGSPQVDRFDNSSDAVTAYLRTVMHWRATGLLAEELGE